MGLIILTGASGSGKTAIAEVIKRDHAGEVAVHHFDSIGVPALDAMIRDHGSPEAWQRDKTIEWLAYLALHVRKDSSVLLEGQMRLSFVVEAAAMANIVDYRLLLIDCDDKTRAKRLAVGRGQPELANEDMMSWAAYLREEAAWRGCEIFDTSRLALDQCVAHMLEHLRQLGQ